MALTVSRWHLRRWERKGEISTCQRARVLFTSVSRMQYSYRLLQYSNVDIVLMCPTLRMLPCVTCRVTFVYNSVASADTCTQFPDITEMSSLQTVGCDGSLWITALVQHSWPYHHAVFQSTLGTPHPWTMNMLYSLRTTHQRACQTLSQTQTRESVTRWTSVWPSDLSISTSSPEFECVVSISFNHTVHILPTKSDQWNFSWEPIS